MGIHRDRGTDEIPDGFGNGRMEGGSMLARHTSKYTQGLCCDGCASFEVLISKRKGIEETRFFCRQKRGYFYPYRIRKCEKRT